MQKQPPSSGDAGGRPSESTAHDQTVILPPSGSVPFHPAPEPILEIGATHGSFRILRLLGRGGMAEVYEAEHIEDGHHVALKALSPRYQHSPDAVSRFLREGRLAASINHPHSVYIFGTEKADEILLIAMELMQGGTLGDRIAKGGPLAPTEAVAAAGQLISGLQAAQAKGILHRDIKPTNCFIDHEGDVKIGDFGLSIASEGEEETQLTVAGSFLGTPAYASPEQVRGIALNVRSDIYSLGATLYCLLAGRGPFDGKQGGQLLAAILEETPVSPREIQPAIPKALSSVVLRCLAKQPDDRYQNYDELREALKPFGPSPFRAAGLGIRFAAGFLDFVILQMMTGLLLLLHPTFGKILAGDPSFASREIFLLAALEMLPAILYAGLLEGLSGFTLGKWLCGLGVVGPEGSKPGLGRGFTRALAFYLPRLLPASIYLSSLSTMVCGVVTDVGALIILALLFITARRANGYRALHGLVSATRVVIRARTDVRPEPASGAALIVQPVTADQIGPYAITGRLSAEGEQEILLGHDPELQRQVWIVRSPGGSPPLPEWRRDLGRIGRLRWVNGRRSQDDAWDVYEALDGQSLLQVLEGRHPWRDVRHWLSDLATELQAGAADESRPASLSLGHIWMTARGRAKLLDFPAPGTKSLSAAAEAVSPQELLHQVAASTLVGRPMSLSESAAWRPAIPLPLHARDLLEKLRTRSDATAADIAGELKASLDRDTAISRPRRLSHLAAQVCLPILVSVGIGMGAYLGAKWIRENPEIGVLEDLLEERDELEESEQARHESLEMYITGRFRALIEDPIPWEAAVYGPNPRINLLRKRARRIVSSRPPPTPEEMEQASAAIGDLVEKVETKLRDRPPLPEALAEITLLVGGGAGGVMAVLALILSAFFPLGLLLRFIGFAVVDGRGQRVSRGRYLGRSLLAGALPILIAGCAVAQQLGSDTRAFLILGLFLILLWFAGVIAAACTPARAPHDRIAGTYLVPR